MTLRGKNAVKDRLLQKKAKGFISVCVHMCAFVCSWPETAYDFTSRVFVLSGFVFFKTKYSKQRCLCPLAYCFYCICYIACGSRDRLYSRSVPVNYWGEETAQLWQCKIKHLIWRLYWSSQWIIALIASWEGVNSKVSLCCEQLWIITHTHTHTLA